MKLKNTVLLLGLLYCSTIDAQFEANFSIVEGYADGDLISNQNWIGTESVFNVDASNSGNITINPKSGNKYSVALYSGEGGWVNASKYILTSVFTLHFDEGEAAFPTTGAVALSFLQLINQNNYNEFSSAALRLTKSKKPGTFNLFVVNKINGDKNAAVFSEHFTARDLGLEFDSSDNWTDATSDQLELVFTLESRGAQKWIETATLKNLTTSKEIASISQITSDADGSFGKSKKTLRLSSDRISENDVIVDIESIVLETDD